MISLFKEEGRGTYGAERICGCLRRDGHKASYQVVKRIMDEEGLKSSHCRRRQRSLTDSRKARSDEYQNLNRDIKITKPFQVLSSDISYVRTGEGFDYLCQVRDVITNTVLAECQSETMKAEPVLQTIKVAQERWRLPGGVIFHSDRGSQYTAKKVMDQVAGYGWQQSFSRVGKPGDNSWSESFFANLKKEIIHWHFYPTRDQARQAISSILKYFTTAGGHKNDWVISAQYSTWNSGSKASYQQPLSKLSGKVLTVERQVAIGRERELKF